MCNLLSSSNFSGMLMFFSILPLPPPPPQAFVRLSSMEHSETHEKWRQVRGPRNTLIFLIINSNIRPNVIVSNCMGMRQILPNAHSDLTREWGVRGGGVEGVGLHNNNNNNNNNNNCLFTNPSKSEKGIKEVIPF